MSNDIPMIARIVFQGKVLQGDILVSYILYNTAIIKTLLYNPYPKADLDRNLCRM